MDSDFPLSLPLPLQQSPQYARAVEALGGTVRSIRIRRNGAPEGWCQVQSRRLGPLGEVRMISRGPVWAVPDSSAALGWLIAWQRRHDTCPLLLNAETAPAEALRRAGFWPLMTGAATAMLPLSDPATMRAGLAQKWRNRLAHAESGPLRLRGQSFDGDPGHWLLAAEARQQRRRRYSALPAALTTAYARLNPGCARLFTASLNGAPVAAMLFLRHGRVATYHIGHALPEGRAHNAHNLLMWQAMTWLAAHGHDRLDLGTLNTQDAPGLARFKLGTGAGVRQLGGTWLHAQTLAPIARHLPARLAA